jgi:hypothetical protein
MIPLLLLPKLFIAGGVFLGVFQLPPETPLDNHTLLGEKISAAQVVTRSRWGTPMLPDGKGGYSLIAPIKKKLIEQSLWIPPVSGARPVVEVPVAATNAAPVPLPIPAAPVSAPAPAAAQ